MTKVTDAPPDDKYRNLTPRKGRLWAVRWVRPDGHEIQHRYFRRQTDALSFATRQRAAGRTCAVFVADTTWRPETAA